MGELINFDWRSFFPFGKMLKSLMGPMYDGKHLHGVLTEELKHTRLSQAITNVIIPAFDIKRLQPVIFSTYEVFLFSFNLCF